MPSEAAGAPNRHGGGPARSRALRARGRLTMRRLLAAAEQVFAAKGYHATRVDDIVKVANTSHGTFYLYFSNKEDLFRALAADVGAAMGGLAAALGPLEPGDSGRAALRVWIAQLSDLYQQHGAVIRASTEADSTTGEFGRLGTDVLAPFTHALSERIAAAAPPGLDAAVLSVALVAMLERVHYYALIGHVEIEREAMIDTLAGVMHASLFGFQA
jgi:AcrR family transcriptional regulator